jgi:Ca-activated chloride channel homolog
MRDVRNRGLDIAAGGSTNLAAGMQLGTKQFNNLYEIDNYEYENRMIVLTDAQPNTGDYSSNGVSGIAQRNAESRIYTTVIGIGVDFNSQLIEEITKIKGANYYSVHSPRQFRERVEEEFEYMVTPLVFDLQMNFQSDGWRIEKVFGSPEADESTGRLMTINTLFASKSEGGETRGGLVLLKLRKTSSGNQSIYLKTIYEDRNGRRDGDSQVLNLETTQPEYFANSGIRKGVLLSRYAALLMNWMADEWQHANYSRPWEPCIHEDNGIIIPVEVNFSQWERQSMPLTVSGPYARIFQNFSDYFESEMDDIDDNDLGKELDIIDMLSRY